LSAILFNTLTSNLSITCSRRLLGELAQSLNLVQPVVYLKRMLSAFTSDLRRNTELTSR